MSEGLVELTVHDIAAGGDGVARLDSGRVVFVPRTAPGDRVVARLTENRARWSRGRLVHVRSGGAGRVDPVCRHFHACGGCGLQHLDTDTQIRALERGVTETLARIGGARIPIRPIRPARARLGYRNRVTFTLRRSGGRAIAGYHRLTGPRLLDVDTCPLAERAIDGAWRALRAGWGRGAGSLPRGRELRLTVRGAADGSAGLYVEGGSDEGDADAVLSRVPELVSYWWRPEGASWRHLGGTAALVERWDGFDVPLRPGAFLQVNREIAPVIDRHLETELGPPGDRRIVELYAGVGLRPLRWAKRGARVTTVEADDGAVETGRDVTRRAGLAVDARHERVEAFLSGPALEADLVVVNPPRGGLSAAAVDGLSAIRAERLAYVSCDAATLARDVGRLAGAWSPVFGQPFDAFPQTGHVETVLWFEPAAP